MPIRYPSSEYFNRKNMNLLIPPYSSLLPNPRLIISIEIGGGIKIVYFQIKIDERNDIDTDKQFERR
jgi:hypothetical protein